MESFDLGAADAERQSSTDSPDPALTPAGLQRINDLGWRRHLMLSLNVAIWLALLGLTANILAAGGDGPLEWIALAALGAGAPWMVLNLTNAALGFWLLHRRRDGYRQATPQIFRAEPDRPLSGRTAILMTLRNEDPARAILRLRIIERSLKATGEGRHFDYFILSDTSRPEIAAREEELVAAWRAEAGTSGAPRITYRRRTVNIGFKAGNLRDFCLRWGDDYTFMLPLDADSLMSGDAILRLQRMMEASPRIGILQSLVVGLPADSAFARLFQFGMRHGMRDYTLGQAWWSGDCGPFWGHNAMIRVAPFRDHCELTPVPGGPPFGGDILSHDQVEAVLMRRAGYEVRVQPIEGGSYEDNPPTLIDYVKRDLRWCRGNLQYVKLLRLPDLKPMSRYQLVWAILMFLSPPAFTLIWALAPWLAARASGSTGFPTTLAIVVYLAFIATSQSPKLFGLLDTLAEPGGAARYGGVLRLGLGAAAEVVASLLMGAITSFKVTTFVASLPFREDFSWGGQAREARSVTWEEAARAFWPETLFGLYVVIGLFVASPLAGLLSLPFTLGYLTAIPFAVLTANPGVGAWLRDRRICAVPEELDVPPEIEALKAAG